MGICPAQLAAEQYDQPSIYEMNRQINELEAKGVVWPGVCLKQKAGHGKGSAQVTGDTIGGKIENLQQSMICR